MSSIEKASAGIAAKPVIRTEPGRKPRAANSTNGKPENAAATRRFLKVLMQTGFAERSNEGEFAAKSAGARVGLPDKEVKALSSRGLVRIKGDICHPTKETGAWLCRQLTAPNDFAGQHQTLASGPGASLCDLNHNPLEKLARAAGGGFLEPYHLAAGTRVCQWGERAHLRQRVTMSYDPAQIGGRRHGGGGDIADMAAEARKALARLFVDLPRDCAEVIVDVCVFEKGLQLIETERGWPRRSAKLVLRIGLEQLAERLGLSPRAVGRPSKRIEAWIGEDFAPTRFE